MTTVAIKIREYGSEMRAIIDAETGQGPYVSATVAREIVEKLRANDPELLHGWLMVHAEQLIRDAINERDRSMRAHARVASSRSVFAAAVERHENGEPEALGEWLGTPFVVADGTRRTLATLTATDLDYVADGYHDRARQNAFEEVFFRALARKCGDGTVADHFTEKQITELRQSLSRRCSTFPEGMGGPVEPAP